MAGITLNVHLEYEEVIERLKAEGWVLPTRCEECIFRNDHRCMRHRIDISNLDFFCSDGQKWSEDIEK